MCIRDRDKIAYVNHDVQDAIWAGDLTMDSLPKHCVEALGRTNSERINALVVDVIRHSHDGVVQQSAHMADVYKRQGLDDGRARTLEEVGREFNVTRERIRQIEAKALRKLRHPSRSKKLRDFLD